MNDATDQQLLSNYAEHRAETAFAELVRRHIDLVHSAAYRMTGEAHSAQDVTQAVFLALANNAARLTRHPVLPGWLHTTTRHLAAKTVRAAVRRQTREQEAAAIYELISPEPSALWDDIAPHLDAALGELNEPDRDAILLRFFEKKSTPEIAANLGISDDAAQKRIHRALGRLRAHFTKRRVPLGAAGLATLLSGHAVQAAPASLAASLSAASAASGAAAVVETLAMTTLQKSLVATALVLSLGFGLNEAREVARLRDKLAALEQSAAQTRLTGDHRLIELTNENVRLRADADRLREKAALVETEEAQDPMIRAMADWLERARNFRGRFKADPIALIPEVQWVGEMHWLEVTRDNRFENEDDYFRAASELRRAAEDVFSGKAHAALKKYLEANEGVFPFNLDELNTYFDEPVDPAILARWSIEPAASVDGVIMGGERVITQRGRFEWALDQRTVIGEHGPGKSMHPDGPYVRAVMAAFAAANAGRTSTDLKELMPYAITPRQRALLEVHLSTPKRM